MNCLVCGNECGTTATPLHYLFRKDSDGQRNDIAPFCSRDCAERYAGEHLDETASVPRCVRCGEIIVNAPWYANLNDDRPRHQECTESIVRCTYCLAVVPGEEHDQVPAVDDDYTWDTLARYHTDDCEWIATRAHRVNIG